MKKRICPFLVACLFSWNAGIYAWEGKVFTVSGKKVTASTQESGKLKSGTTVYVMKDGKEIGQCKVTKLFHTKVELILTQGVAQKGLLVTDKKIVATGASCSTAEGIISAAEKGDAEKIQAFISSGADVNVNDDKNCKPLAIAAKKGHTEVVKLLLAAKASIDANTRIKDPGDSPDSIPPMKTPLMYAASARHTEVVKLLVAGKANVNATTDNAAHSVLMFAAMGGDAEILDLLIVAGAEVDYRDMTGATPLMYAASGGHVKAVELLIGKGANVNNVTRAPERQNVLDWAKRHKGIVKILKKAGAY